MSGSDNGHPSKKGKMEEEEIFPCDLKSQLQDIQRTLRKIDERGEKLEAAIYSLQQENDKLRKQVDNLMNDKQDLKAENERVKSTMRKMKMQHNHLEQWSRKWNVRIWGLQDEERETTDNCISKVTNFFRCELGLSDFPPDRIDVAHRLGKFRETQKRAVIVRFLHLTDRTLVLQTKGRLKGKPFGIAEDLTGENYRLLNKVKQMAGRGNAWSRDGVIFARLQSGRTVRVDETTSLSDYFDTPPSSRETTLTSRSQSHVQQFSGASRKDVRPRGAQPAKPNQRPGVSGYTARTGGGDDPTSQPADGQSVPMDFETGKDCDRQPVGERAPRKGQETLK